MLAETPVNPRKRAAVVYDVGVAIDDLIAVFARELVDGGARVGGLFQLPRGDTGCGPFSPLRMCDAATGEVFAMCQRNGRDCRPDPTMMRRAAMLIRDAAQSSVDLFFLGRFGSSEALGEGLLDSVTRAALRDRAALTAVARGQVDRWLSLGDGIGTLLDARLWVLKDWWRGVAASGPTPVHRAATEQANA